MADAPPALLERLGTAVDPLVPKRSRPAESTIRRLLARIDADALDRAVGAWLAGRQTRGQGLRGQSPSRESAESGNILAQRRDEEVKVAACRVRTDRVDVVA